MIGSGTSSRRAPVEISVANSFLVGYGYVAQDSQHPDRIRPWSVHSLFGLPTAPVCGLACLRDLLVKTSDPMNSKTRRKLRQSAAIQQNHLCYYCCLPMWHDDSEDFFRDHKLPKRFTKYLQCTAEHLVARQDNGKDAASNIVAACIWCNSMRHFGRSHKAPEAHIYRSKVRRLVSMGRWHPLAASGFGRSLRQSKDAR